MADSSLSSTVPARAADAADAALSYWQRLDRGYQATLLGVALLAAVSLLP